jgi:ferric-dicitrate binding protein FerR (iron transport regulator)
MSDGSLRSGKELRTKPPRRRHWRRRILLGLLALVVLVVVAVVAIIGLQPSQPPLALPAGVAAAPAGQLDGSWHVATGSAFASGRAFSASAMTSPGVPVMSPARRW